MTAVTTHTTERLGEKCNFTSSMRFKKKKNGVKNEPGRITCLQQLELVVITIMMSLSQGRASVAHTKADHKEEKRQQQKTGGSQGSHNLLINAG